MKKKKKSLIGYLGENWYRTFRFDKYDIVKDKRQQLELHKNPSPIPRDKKVKITIKEL